jgi:cytochrome b561
MLFCHLVFIMDFYNCENSKRRLHDSSFNNHPQKMSSGSDGLHWIIAILIFTTVLLAGDGGEGRRQAGAGLGGISTINIHMILGILILVLLIIRLVVRFVTQRPAWASTGNAIFNKIGELTHWGLYLLTFGMTITGIILATQTNRLEGLFGLAGNQPADQFTPGRFPPPGQFRDGGGFRFGLGGLHGMIWTLLLLLILLHVGAAFYHQFFIKDKLLRRMWFGKRYEA